MRFHRKSAMVFTSFKGVDAAVKRFVLITLLIVMVFSLLGCKHSQQPPETDGTIPSFTASMTMPVLYEEPQDGS